MEGFIMNSQAFDKDQTLIHTWKYHDREGKVIGCVNRFEDINGTKQIIPCFIPNQGGFKSGINLSPRPLFGLDKLKDHPKDKAVFIVEGEKSAAALHGINLCAVTSLGGAQASGKSDWSVLSGYKMVIVLPDNDKPGENYAACVCKAIGLLDSPPEIKMVRLPNLPPHGDIVNWLQDQQSDWDGYKPLGDSTGKLKKALREVCKNPSPLPDFGDLADLAGEKLNDSGWKTPNDLTPKLLPVQELLLEMIPEPLRGWIGDSTHRMQTPIDFSAVTALVVIGSIIGAGCNVRPKKEDDWKITPNLWGACIGRPSVVLKTPSMNEGMSFLDNLQEAYGEIYDKKIIESEFDELTKKARTDFIKSQLAKLNKEIITGEVADSVDITRLKEEYCKLTKKAKDETPYRRIFKTNEISIQAMTMLQQQNPRGVLMFRDELTGLMVKWTREDGADERAYFLEGWNGDGSYTDFKVGRGLTDAKNICISLLGGIQPDKLKHYLSQAKNGNNDGLIQRFQLGVWPNEPDPTKWEFIDATPNKAEKDRVNKICEKLAEMDFVEFGATQDGNDEKPYFRFDSEAQVTFNEWFKNMRTVKIPQEKNPLMLEHLGKYPSLVPSLALIFHCIGLADGEPIGNISKKNVQLAVDWVEYLETHARRIYGMGESLEYETALRLIDKIKDKVLKSPFTCKAVYDKNWQGLTNKKEVKAACDILAKANWIRVETKPASGRAGRPPDSEYHLHPILL